MAYEKIARLGKQWQQQLKSAIGQEATVSVQIDAKMQGKGKVVVRVGNREMELLAVTEDNQRLQRGEVVQVYGIEDNIVLVSAKINWEFVRCNLN